MTLILSACQKVDPNVVLFDSGKPNPLLPDPDLIPDPIETDPRMGRVTAGSSEYVQSGGVYQLKGRVSFVPGHQAENGSYQLRGTVKF